MKLILLSGGSGKRLWPLSSGIRTKQFIKVLPKEDGSRESMVQRVARQIKDVIPGTDIIVATSESQADLMCNQLNGDINIVTEPSRRDTFPAIALASKYLSDKLNIYDEEVLVVMPCDPYTEPGYFNIVKKMAELVENDHSELVLMGITPDSPSSKFGYIIPDEEDSSKVKCFTEKPTFERACQLLDEGAVWNGGVFAFKLGYIKSIINKYIKTDSFDELRARYDELPKISFDYEVVEKAKSVGLVPFAGKWKDLGTWDALCKELGADILGNAIMAENKDTTIVNELGIPIVAIGCENLIIAASKDGILISKKDKSERIKDMI